jgi:hypothetical protein
MVSSYNASDSEPLFLRRSEPLYRVQLVRASLLGVRHAQGLLDDSA